MSPTWAVAVWSLVAIWSGGFVSRCESLSVNEVDYLVGEVRALIDNNTNTDEYGLPFKTYVPTLVRLAFHMCISGVCDGCINVKDSNNNHLQPVITALQSLRNRSLANGINVSYADLMALAGVVALNVAEELASAGQWQPVTNYTFNIPFKFGRKDCAKAPYTDAYLNFPAHTGGIQHVIYWFQTYQKLTAKETVAIMGLHKLGGLRRGNSESIYAQWAYAPDVLDNGYYRDLSNRDGYTNWKASYVAVPGYKAPYYMWRQQPLNNRIMFNCDIGLYKDLRFGSCDPNNVTCSYNGCAQSYLTGSIVLSYAQDNELWLKDVSRVFEKVICSGYADGELQPPTPV